MPNEYDQGFPLDTDVLVVGAGPAGSAWPCRRAHAAGSTSPSSMPSPFPVHSPAGWAHPEGHRGTGTAWGLSDWLTGRARKLRASAAGFWEFLYSPLARWLPAASWGWPRLGLDAAIRQVALDAGANPVEGYRAVDVRMDAGAVAAVQFASKSGSVDHAARDHLPPRLSRRRRCPVPSPGRSLGRTWHRSTAYGVAAVVTVKSHRSDDPWISSHLELRGEQGIALRIRLIFPLGTGR
jgi:hypothetical protein